MPDKRNLDNLSRKIRRIDHRKSIHDNQASNTYISSLSKESLEEWLEKLLPNTKLIIEPKINGCAFLLQYEQGLLVKSITKRGAIKAEDLRKVKNIPIKIEMQKHVQIRGEIYESQISGLEPRELSGETISKALKKGHQLSFCAFQIVNSEQNQYQALQSLQDLGFEIPDTEFTNFTNEVVIYRQLWKEGKLFKKFPTNGIVIKVNSRKLQKQLGENMVCLKWALAINN